MILFFSLIYKQNEGLQYKTLKSKGDWKFSNIDNLDIFKLNVTQTLNVISIFT